MRLKYFFLLFSFAGFLFSNLGCQNSPRSVAEVIDGDTLILAGGRHLRLIGIDTPEVRRKIKGEFVYDPQPYALAATEFVRRQLKKGKVRLEFDIQKQDQFGRLLGYCFIDTGAGEIMLNSEILKAGLGVVYVRFPDVKYLSRLVAAEEEARRSQCGLWSQPEITPQAAKDFVGQIRTVKGKVYAVYEGRRVILLHLASSEADFHITIFKDSLALFSRRHIDPSRFYLHKTVIVTGRIRKYKGAIEIIVGCPEQIRLSG